MKNTRQIAGVFVMMAIAIGWPMLAEAASQFVRIPLAKGVSVDLPSDWTVLSGSQRSLVAAHVQSRLGSAGLEDDFPSDLSFAANYYDERGRAIGIFNIRYYPEQDVSQADAKAFGAAEMREIDAALRQMLEKSLEKSLVATGSKMVSWGGTQKVSLAGNYVLLTEYKRTSISPGQNFRVRLVRFLRGGQSFTVTVSYREDQSFMLEPIANKIINSIRLGQ